MKEEKRMDPTTEDKRKLKIEFSFRAKINFLMVSNTKSIVNSVKEFVLSLLKPLTSRNLANVLIYIVLVIGPLSISNIHRNASIHELTLSVSSW